MDNNSREEKSAMRAREEKVKNFHININKDDLAVGERYRKRENIDAPQPEAISSFSDDDIRKQMKKHSKNQAKEELKAVKKQQKYIDRQNRRISRLVWWVSVALVGFMLALYIIIGVNDMLAVGRPADNTVNISIPENPTVKDVSAELKSKGVIDEPHFFELYAKLTKNDEFSQGDYNIKTNMDYEAIINYLASMSNRTDTISVTITEGMNVQEIAKYLVKKGVLASEDHFLELCNSDYFDEDYKFVNTKNSDKRYYKLEGYLFPDTYECYKNERAELTITRMLNDYESRTTTNQNVEGYSKAINVSKLVKKTDYNLTQTLIIASMIQAEAASSDDMYYISSIIHNRLDSDPDSGVLHLDLDSTKYYPFRSKSDVPQNIRKTFKSTYNTYKLNGLPVGPICNPGMEAIMAAIYPNDTDYLYFCHDKKGNPYYASTLYEHEYNLSIAGLL